MNEQILWQAVIENAIDCSFKDEKSRLEEMEWFNSQHYIETYYRAWGEDGSKFKELMQLLWDDVETNPDNAKKYRQLFRAGGGVQAVRDFKGRTIVQRWVRPRDKYGRFMTDDYAKTGVEGSMGRRKEADKERITKANKETGGKS